MNVVPVEHSQNTFQSAYDQFCDRGLNWATIGQNTKTSSAIRPPYHGNDETKFERNFVNNISFYKCLFVQDQLDTSNPRYNLAAKRSKNIGSKFYAHFCKLYCFIVTRYFYRGETI